MSSKRERMEKVKMKDEEEKWTRVMEERIAKDRKSTTGIKWESEVKTKAWMDSKKEMKQ